MTTPDQTSRGLRDMLFKTLGQLQAGECEANHARAVAAVAHQIISTVHMEIEVAKLRRDYPGDTALIVPPPLRLNGK